METLLVSSQKFDPEGKDEKTKRIVISREQNARYIQHIKVGNKSFEIMTKLIYLGTTLANQNCVLEEIECKLSSWSVYQHSVQNLLSSCLLKMK